MFLSLFTYQFDINYFVIIVSSGECIVILYIGENLCFSQLTT